MFGNHLFLIGCLALTSDIKRRWPERERGDPGTQEVKGVTLGPKKERE